MHEDCTIYRTVDVVGKKWTMLIMLQLNKGEQWKRYSELKKGLLGITPKILSLRLKELEAENLISKKVDASVVPVKCEYALTESGKDFMRVLKDIKLWALKWNILNPDCDAKECKHCLL